MHYIQKAKEVLWTWTVVKSCAAEMMSKTFQDHNQGGQPGQLAAGNLQGGSKQCNIYCEKVPVQI